MATDSATNSALLEYGRFNVNLCKQSRCLNHYYPPQSTAMRIGFLVLLGYFIAVCRRHKVWRCASVERLDPSYGFPHSAQTPACSATVLQKISDILEKFVNTPDGIYPKSFPPQRGVLFVERAIPKSFPPQRGALFVERAIPKSLSPQPGCSVYSTFNSNLHWAYRFCVGVRAI